VKVDGHWVCFDCRWRAARQRWDVDLLGVTVAALELED
jgi:hypothetical protein